MKQLTCEMCGSTDLLKRDGVFVCQTCGTKYSVEEAKKMMIEGTVDVSGSTIRVDSSKELENLRVLARRAKDSNNSQEAEKYYSKILVLSPNDWEAAFYNLYYSSLNIKIAQINATAATLKTSLAPIFKTLSLIDNANEKTKAIEEIVIRIAALCEILYSNSLHSFAESYEQYGSTSQLAKHLSNATEIMSVLLYLSDEIDRYKNDPPFYETLSKSVIVQGKCFINMFINTPLSLTKENRSKWTFVLTPVVTRIEKFDTSYRLPVPTYKGYPALMIQLCSGQAKESGYSEYCQSQAKRMQQVAEKAKQERYDIYWREHSQEKEALLSEKSKISEKINLLIAQINEIDSQNSDRMEELRKEASKKTPGEIKADTQHELIFELTKQQAKCGIFKRKEKQLIQARLDEEYPKFEALKKQAAIERTAYKEKIASEIAAIKDESKAQRNEIASLQKRYDEITLELKKDR